MTYSADAGSDVYSGSGTATAAGNRSAAPPAGGGGGRAGHAAGGGSTMPLAGTGSVQRAAAGTGGAAEQAGITRVSFDVTTVPQGGWYQPRNIGAIWIETRAGQFVRSLEVWARSRRRYLTRYDRAVGAGGSVDVVAGPTLMRHKRHLATWDLTDRTGAKATVGAYRVFVEVTDADATGQYYALDFDTSTGAQTLTPADQTYFKMLSLTVQ